MPGSFYIETSFEYLFESGTYDEDGMRNLLGSRIWVARQFIKEYAWYEIDCSDFLAESMDLDLFDDNAKVLEFDDVPFSYDDILVAKYDWLRKKDFILRCEDYPRGEF